VKLKKRFELDKNFIELWNKIKHKTTYRVDYDSQDIINKACERIEEIKDIIKTPQIISQKNKFAN
jgi:type III restriction enzyme